MENYSTIENALNSKTKTDSESMLLNHENLSNNVNNVGQNDISKSKPDTIINDNHIDKTYNILKQNEDVDKLIDDDDSLEKDVEPVNCKFDEDELLRDDTDKNAPSGLTFAHSDKENALTNDHTVTNNDSEIACSPNEISVTEKINATIQSDVTLDSEDDFLSAAEHNEVTDIINEDKLLEDDVEHVVATESQQDVSVNDENALVSMAKTVEVLHADQNEENIEDIIETNESNEVAYTPKNKVDAENEINISDIRQITDTGETTDVLQTNQSEEDTNQVIDTNDGDPVADLLKPTEIDQSEDTDRVIDTNEIDRASEATHVNQNEENTGNVTDDDQSKKNVENVIDVDKTDQATDAPKITEELHVNRSEEDAINAIDINESDRAIGAPKITEVIHVNRSAEDTENVIDTNVDDQTTKTSDITEELHINRSEENTENVIDTNVDDQTTNTPDITEELHINRSEENTEDVIDISEGEEVADTSEITEALHLDENKEGSENVIDISESDQASVLKITEVMHVDQSDEDTENVIETKESGPATGTPKIIETLHIDRIEEDTNDVIDTTDGDQVAGTPKTTEVLHIDQSEEDTDDVIDVNESDPFGQVDESNAEPDQDKRIDDSEVVVSEVNLFEPVAEADAGTPQANAELVEKTPLTESVSEETDRLSNHVEEDGCIIPDSVENDTDTVPVESEVNDASKISTVVPAKPKKFDITPVRLEKLMDPSKLIVKEKLVNDVESVGIVGSGRPQRKAAKKAESQIKEIVAQTEGERDDEDKDKSTEPSMQVCCRCSRLRFCKYITTLSTYACAESCFRYFTEKKLQTTSKLITKSGSGVLQKSSIPDSIHFLRKCGQCGLHNIVDEKSLSWEAMDFCNDDCLSRYQSHNGSYCAYCKTAVQHTSMGKYSVRFGLEARQFCSGSCLEDFKKGLKSCSYCQQDITKATNAFVAPVGDKEQMKDFCSKECSSKYERMASNLPIPHIQDTCTVCRQHRTVDIRVLVNSKTHMLCSDVCFNAFKYANNMTDTDQCNVCKLHYEERNTDCYFVFHDSTPYTFCCKVCMNVFILFNRKIVPCNWCKVKKYNFDMIKRSVYGSGPIMMCSLNCLTLYQVSMNAASTRKIKCDTCNFVTYAQYHLTMSDATIRNFCSYNCVMVFQTQYNKQPLTVHDKSTLVPVPLGGPKKTVYQPKNTSTTATVPVVQKSTVTLANGLLPQFTANKTATLKISNPITVQTSSSANLTSSVLNTPPLIVQPPPPPPVTKYIQQIIVKPAEAKDMSNKITQCRPSMLTKGVSCKPNLMTQETQTDEHLKYPALLPIPIPIYVPVPMHMFTTPFPVPVPFPLPIPVPVLIPTTKNTYKGVMHQIKEILEKTPANPYEADLLLMAKMVAGGEEKVDDAEEVTRNDSGDDDDTHFADAAPDLSDSETFVDAENNVPINITADDVLQIALKIATEQLTNTPTVDLEAELTSNTITPQTQTEDNPTIEEVPEVPAETKPRTRKRATRSSSSSTATTTTEGTPTKKRGRYQVAPPPSETETPNTDSISQPTPAAESTSPSVAAVEGEQPDSNMCLKFTIGVRAWKQWVVTKNEQIERAAAAANKKAKTFNTNILKLTTDELNFLLCTFVKEVRKPNGVEYAPDTIYYLCLSIQQYLFENGRIDNIFTDSFYEPFTNALDDIAKKFSEVNDATQFVVTRVQEEHLWESKQLGAHSPHVLLATLMFFNTKYFNLATLEEHMQLSFSHIMKHWKRNPNAPIGKPGSPAPNRNVVLRFYPPQSALDAPNSRKKKVYEQHENEVNPLRCPVKLYEFYLSKCPESVKQRNDVFYLQPERSCVPDSPVWYSTMPLQKDLLMKMLHRIRMVKEVNISLLAS